MSFTEKVLQLHGIETRNAGGRIYAASLYTVGGILFTEWEDVTTWNRSQLFSWLGY